MADQLEAARKYSLDLLARIPKGAELFVDMGTVGKTHPDLILGIGLLIGKGHAAYRGDGHYRLTDAGRTTYETDPE